MKIESHSILGATFIDTGDGDVQWILGPEDLGSLSEKPLRTQQSEKYAILHSAASAFLSEYESYRTGDAVAFTPSPEVLEAFRKAVGG